MQEMTIKEIHAAELEVLKGVDEICRRIGVKYWVLFGTLLGAVREHGFIPWDDDLDICMKREDYDKLIAYFIQRGGGALHLNHFFTVKNYPYYIARISEKENYINFEDGRYQSGIFIDVYPLDGLEGPQWLKSFRKKIIGICLINFYLDDKFFPLKGKNFFRKILFVFYTAARKILRSLLGSERVRKFEYDTVTKLAKKYKFNESEFVGIPSWELKRCFQRKSFDETVYLKFEDIEVPAPAGYDDILKSLYGDYMQLPPENERKPHHDYIAYKE